METKNNLIKQAQMYADENFDEQMLKHLTIIRVTKTFHAQHRTMLLEYVYQHKKDNNE